MSSRSRLFEKLPPAPRKKILEYIQEPSLVGWKQIRGLPVFHGQTLNDMLDMVDFCWPGDYPSMILLARTSKLIERRAQDLTAMEM